MQVRILSSTLWVLSDGDGVGDLSALDREFKSLRVHYADVAQLVESLPSKQTVEGSSPFIRSRENACSEVHLVQT